LALGLAHIFFGIFLSGYYKWIHGAKAEAFWTAFTSHLLFGAVILSFTMKEPWVPWVLWISIALFIWGKGYGSPWYLRPIMGILGAVNFMIGLLSNGLSYLRLLALGLVTGAIALAVNQVAAEMGGLLPVWIGIPCTIIIAVIGHTVSIALNTLGSFIHSGRLQFIEFFSQFFEGGGRQFSPFSRSTF
jgi:V/A-type H+/Na+-transporting ATPase subunit I